MQEIKIGGWIFRSNSCA